MEYKLTPPKPGRIYEATWYILLCYGDEPNYVMRSSPFSIPNPVFGNLGLSTPELEDLEIYKEIRNDYLGYIVDCDMHPPNDVHLYYLKVKDADGVTEIEDYINELIDGKLSQEGFKVLARFLPYAKHVRLKVTELNQMREDVANQKQII